MVRRFISAGLVCLVAAGCQPSSGPAPSGQPQGLSSHGMARPDNPVQAALDSWKGRDLPTLITVYGSPAEIVDVPGGTVYSFASKTVIEGNDSLSTIGGLFGMNKKLQSALDTTGQKTVQECVVNFHAKGQTVVMGIISRKDNNWLSNECHNFVKPYPA